MRSTVSKAMEERGTERGEEMREKMQQMFCSRFTETAGKIATGLANGREKFDQWRTGRVEHMDDGRETRDAKLGDSRSDADTKRSEMYQKLEEKADTDAKKEAVEEFQKTVEQAVETRREAVDAALAAFRSGVDSLLANRKDKAGETADTFEAAVKAAVEKAKAECADGTSPETVRTHFQTALQAAHKALEADRSSTDKISDEIRALADTKHAAIEKAMNDFKTTVEAAAAKLKAAMGEDKE